MAAPFLHMWAFTCRQPSWMDMSKQSAMAVMLGGSMMKNVVKCVSCRPRCHGKWTIGIWLWIPFIPMPLLAVWCPFGPSSIPRERDTVLTSTATAGVTANHVSTPMHVQIVAGRAMHAARVALWSQAREHNTISIIIYYLSLLLI